MSTMPLLDNFALNLRDAMKRAGINGMQLAEKAGVHYVTVSRVLNGKLSPTVETCERLAEAAGMRPDTAFLEPVKKS